MKRSLLGLSLAGITVVAVAILGIDNNPERKYQPRENEQSKEEARGAIEYLHSMRANQITGEVDLADVQAAKQQLNQMSVNKTAAVGLNWEFRGPDNYGGRTRAFIIDKDSNNVLYAAGVASGVFKSKNGGLSWVPISDEIENMNVCSLAQGADGALYAGTGEGLYTFPNGTTWSSGRAGGGVYKSTDYGRTWTVLTNTVPPSANSGWSAVGALGCDPNNANRLYACTRGGLQSSNDGGQTWSNPVGPTAVSRSTDMAMGSNGSIWVNVGSITYFSPTGNPGSFQEKSTLAGGTDKLPRNSGRMRYAIAPQDEDVVYCLQTANSAWNGLYISEDQGDTWELIQNATSTFDPLCAAKGCQGTWDLMLQVSPFDKFHVFAGGISVWEWKKPTGWRQVDGFGPFYIHADQHQMIFDPVNPLITYITHDGGISKSTDGGFTWQEVVRNFSTTQFYHTSVGPNREIVGGTQDQGSFVVDGTGNTKNTGRQLGPVASAIAGNFLGDGFYSHISFFDDDQYYTSYQRGVMGRSRNRGVDFTEFYSVRMIAGTGGPNSSDFAPWSMPYIDYETTTDMNSADSISFKSAPTIRSLGFSSDTTHVGTLPKPQESANFLASSFNVVSGAMTIVSDANGNLSGSGSGTFDAATGAYNFTFDNTPVAEILITCDVNYNAGAVVTMNSLINDMPFLHTLSQSLPANDSVNVQDPNQAMIICGLNNGLWITREPFDYSDERTEWWKILDFNGSTGRPSCVEISDDGSTIWAGTENGRIYRITGIDKARDPLTADIVLGADSNKLEIQADLVGTFGRFVTSIAVHPDDNDVVAVTLGNYGNGTFVRYTTNGMDPTINWSGKQGNLPMAPVYTATFDKGDTDVLIIGTEFGIFTTDNINAGSPTWTEENNGIPRVAVFTLEQYRSKKSSTPDFTVFEGDIFAGSHARGFFMAEDLKTARPVSVEENDPIVFENNTPALDIFPNPAVDFTQIKIENTQSETVTVFVRDINGRLVSQMKLNNLPRGEQNIRLNTAEFASGTYIVNVQQGDNVTSGKFVVTK